MSEKRFTNVSIGMEEAYCDFSIIKVGDKIISDGIPTTDAIGICDLLNELNDENKELKKENNKLRLKYMNRGLAITEAVEDLYRTEEVYLAGFNICRRITEYEREFNE